MANCDRYDAKRQTCHISIIDWRIHSWLTWRATLCNSLPWNTRTQRSTGWVQGSDATWARTRSQVTGANSMSYGRFTFSSTARDSTAEGFHKTFFDSELELTSGYKVTWFGTDVGQTNLCRWLLFPAETNRLEATVNESCAAHDTYPNRAGNDHSSIASYCVTSLPAGLIENESVTVTLSRFLVNVTEPLKPLTSRSAFMSDARVVPRPTKYRRACYDDSGGGGMGGNLFSWRGG